jgi:hypothetical protein
MIALALVAFAPITAHADDRAQTSLESMVDRARMYGRATVYERVAAQCRKDWPTDYVTQLGCRQIQMEAFDKLDEEDRTRDLLLPHDNTPAK